MVIVLSFVRNGVAIAWEKTPCTKNRHKCRRADIAKNANGRYKGKGRGVIE